MKVGVIFRWGSLWIGGHYSPYCKRWCINLIPYITIWIASAVGIDPQGNTISGG